MTKIKNSRIMQISRSKYRVEYQVETPLLGGFEPDHEWYSYDVYGNKKDALEAKEDLFIYGLDGVEIQ